MKEHKDIQDPKDFKDLNYQLFEAKLFSKKTTIKELEEICMTLSHLPTKRAQELLNRFKESERASEVGWLECAVEEGKFQFMSPNNDEEEKDFIALKLTHKNNDRIADLMDKQSQCEFKIKEYEIELDALQILEKTDLTEQQKEDIKYRILAIKDILIMENNHLKDTIFDIEMSDKINDAIIENIKTEKYKGLQPWDIEGIYLDGEAF